MRATERFHRQLGVLCLAALLAQSAPAEIRYTDRSAEAQVTTRHNNLGLFVDGSEAQNYYGSGVAFEDINLDGWPDLILASGETGRCIYINQQDGTFRDASSWFGQLPRGTSTGVALADVDNNGKLDLMMNNYYDEPWFFVGTGSTFSEQAPLKGLSPLMFSTGQEPTNYEGPQSMGLAFGDWNHDGLVDIYVANYHPDKRDMLLRSLDGSYFQRTTRVDVPAMEAGFQPVFLDLDDDGDLDIYVANDFGVNFFFENAGPAGNYQFTQKAGALKIAGNANWPSDHVMSMGVAIGDFDNDLDLDIYIANYFKNALYVNPGGPGPNERFTEMAVQKGIEYPLNSWGTSFLDADNDGDLDLCLTAGWIHSIQAIDQGRLLEDRFFENLGAPDYKFADVTANANFADVQSGRGLAVADYDRDGKLDVAVWNCSLYDPDLTEPFTYYPGDFRLYHNESTSSGHWVALRLIGRGVPYTNLAGIGARVWITAGGKTQMREVRAGESFMSHNSLEVEFGLGDAQAIDEVRVRWTTGVEEVFRGVKVDAIQALVEGSGVASKYGTLVTKLQSSWTGQGIRLDWSAAPWLRPDELVLERAPAGAEPLQFAAVDPSELNFRERYVSDCSVDANAEYVYRLTLSSHGGSFVETVVSPALSGERDTPCAPLQMLLEQNVPNPFNPGTDLRFALPSAQPVQLAIYDLRGRLVRVLVDQPMPAGDHSIHFDGRDKDGNSLASGTYIYALRTAERTIARRLTLLR